MQESTARLFAQCLNSLGRALDRLSEAELQAIARGDFHLVIGERVHQVRQPSKTKAVVDPERIAGVAKELDLLRDVRAGERLLQEMCPRRDELEALARHYTIALRGLRRAEEIRQAILKGTIEAKLDAEVFLPEGRAQVQQADHGDSIPTEEETSIHPVAPTETPVASGDPAPEPVPDKDCTFRTDEEPIRPSE